MLAGRGREGYEGGRGQEGQEGGRGGRGPPRSAPALPVPTTEFNFDEGLQKFDKQKLKEVLPGCCVDLAPDCVVKSLIRRSRACSVSEHGC